MTLFYGDGKFEFINDETDRAYCMNAHKAITLTENWEYLRTFVPEKGFMFSKSHELDQIALEMRKDPISHNHSGASYAGIMRIMEFIAKNGIEEYKNLYLQQCTG
jgi:hypothetical protein